MTSRSGARDRTTNLERLIEVLLVAPLFAPSSLVGALRWSNLTRSLAERGVVFDLMVPRRPEDALHAEASRTAHGIRETFELPPLRLSPGERARRRIAARAPLVAPPEPDVDYWRRHARRLPSTVPLTRYDAVVTTGPPHSIHQVGLVAAEHGVPWVADFRDPLIGDSRFDVATDGAKRRRVHSFHAAIVANASAVVHASHLSARLMGRLSAGHPSVHIVRNGADLERLAPSSVALEPTAVLFERSTLEIASFGRWARSDVSILARALSAMRLDATVHLYGQVTPGHDDPHVDGSASTRIISHGQVSHEEALSQMGQPRLLAMLLGQERSNVAGTSTKLYEYIATGNPILVLNPTRADRELLEGVERCAIVDLPSLRSVRQALDELRDLPPLTADGLRARRESVSRTAAAAKMLQIIRGLVR